MRPDGIHLSKSKRLFHWWKSYKVLSPAIMIGLFILGLTNLSFVFICVKDKNKLTEENLNERIPRDHQFLANQLRNMMPTELVHLMNDANLRRSLNDPKNAGQVQVGKGPVPPIFLYRPLCREKNNCQNISEKEIKSLFSTNGFNITENEFAPWTITLTNGVNGLPRVRKLWQHSNLFPSLSSVCLKEHLCLQYPKWFKQLKSLEVMKPCWDVNTPEFRRFIESKNADIVGYYLVRLAGGRHGSSSKFNILHSSAKSLLNALKKNAYIETNDTELRRHTTLEEYIHEPFLINGKKHAVRIYLLVKSLDPLEVYLSDFGEVAFARDDYANDEKLLKKECRHFDIWAQSQCAASKLSWKLNSASSMIWTLDHYWWQLSKLKILKDTVMTKLKDVLAKFSILMASSVLGSLHPPNSRVTIEAIRKNGFALLQLDLLLDKNLQPWILDVDCDPGFHQLSNPVSHRAQWLKQMILEFIQMKGYFRDEFDSASYGEQMIERFKTFCEKRGGCSEQDVNDLTRFEHSYHGRKVFKLIFPAPATSASYTKLLLDLKMDTVIHEYAVFLGV